MQAITYERYGGPDVLSAAEIVQPVPAPEEILIRVHAAAVTTTDCTARSGRPYFSRLAFGLRRPKHHVLGTELAGVVESIGSEVTRFQPGDEVFAATGDSFGAHAEYITLPEDAAIAIKPANLAFDEAVAIGEGALTALPFLRDHGRIRAGHKVLVNGASGAVGTAAVQLAKHFGADVTAVCGSSHGDLVRSLGADTVIDYTREDFVTTGQTWDIIFDAVGKRSYLSCRNALTEHGIYLTTVPSLAIFPQMLWTSRFGDRHARIAFTGLRKPAERARDLDLISDLAEAGTIRPVIDERYSFTDIVDAHRHVETGHKKGAVVVSIR